VSNATPTFNGNDKRHNLGGVTAGGGGSRLLMAVRNESEVNFTTTSFVEGDILLTVHLASDGNSPPGNQL
jgi:hypothetical protein